GEATEEERSKWKYTPEGEKLAAKYLAQDCNLATELSKYEENITGYIKEGITDILIRNINLPKNDLAKRNNKRAMDGLKILKEDGIGAENVYSKIRRIFTHYTEQGEQQRTQAYQSLKTEFETKLQQAIAQQIGPAAGIKIDVESQPQFQEEWRKIQTQLDSQYLSLLGEYKQELLNIT
ncbi:hypothetical protein ACFLVM_03490, partial [Chloroflexota bacterium]